jgi:hypothetical protein
MPDRYAVPRRGPQHEFSPRRVRNAARRMAWKMAHDAYKAMLEADPPDDPVLASECRRALEDLKRRAGKEDFDDER